MNKKDVEKMMYKAVVALQDRYNDQLEDEYIQDNYVFYLSPLAYRLYGERKYYSITVCVSYKYYEPVVLLHKDDDRDIIIIREEALETDDEESLVERILGGEFGCGLTRKRKLEAAGYNYNEVQKKVNVEAVKRFGHSTTEPNEPWKISFGIKDVKFNGPATIVFWMDGSKTVVKCSEDDVFDKEKGLAMAIIKKMYGDDNSYHKIFKKWCYDIKAFCESLHRVAEMANSTITDKSDEDE